MINHAKNLISFTTIIFNIIHWHRNSFFHQHAHLGIKARLQMGSHEMIRGSRLQLSSHYKFVNSLRTIIILSYNIFAIKKASTQLMCSSL